MSGYAPTSTWWPPPTPSRTGRRSAPKLFLALTDENGNLIWISPARKGSASEITATRHDKLTAHLRTAGLGALADLGFVGIEDDPDDPVIVTGYKATRAPNEHGLAALKTWRVLTRLRLKPARATVLLGALLVLTRLEITR
jgi:hypothetical protein